ncbi:MAG: Wzy polymerase domain-containing protein [Gallionella sp.]|nr:Wzy polymerase domain-containing protein [Gallionella sp.]
MLKNSYTALRKTHISLALVGLMWVLPFLHYRHEYPLTTFDQEWWAVLFGVLAMATLAGKDYWKSAQLPGVVLLPVTLIVVAVLQITVGKIIYAEQGMLYILYLLFAAQMMLLGAWLRRDLGMDTVTLCLAIALLFGAEVCAAIGVLQHFAVHSWFDSVIVRKIGPGLYGNIAQPNHYANYISLGIASLGLLYQKRKLGMTSVILLALPLLFVMTLSGSRTSWLYLIAMLVLAAWMRYKDRSLSPLLSYSIAIIVSYLMMHWLVQIAPHAGNVVDTTSLRTSDTSGYIRLQLWQESVQMFMRFPLLGAGFGQFAYQHLTLQPLFPASHVTGLYNNAHNVVLQLAAETGLAGLLPLLVIMGGWAYGLRDAKRSASHWWCYALIAVITIHGLLEYPLWYVYFLSIIAFLLGLADETSFKLDMPRVGRVAMTAVILTGAVVLAHLKYSYLQVKTALIMPVGAGAESAQLYWKNLVAIRDKSWLMLPLVDMYIGNTMSVDERNLKQKLVFNTNTLHYIPSAEAVYRQAYMLAEAGELAEAKVVLTQALYSYPNNPNARNLLMRLAENDPAHFSALLEFAVQQEQEIARAVRIK